MNSELHMYRRYDPRGIEVELQRPKRRRHSRFCFGLDLRAKPQHLRVEDFAGCYAPTRQLLGSDLQRTVLEPSWRRRRPHFEMTLRSIEPECQGLLLEKRSSTLFRFELEREYVRWQFGEKHRHQCQFRIQKWLVADEPTARIDRFPGGRLGLRPCECIVSR